jgi:hypothetical protein
MLYSFLLKLSAALSKLKALALYALDSLSEANPSFFAMR